MKIHVISNPSNVPNESILIKFLLDNGIETFHLRKPNLSKDELRGILAKIPSHHYKKIIIHYHPSLAIEFNLKGAHFNKGNISRYNDFIFESPNKSFEVGFSGHNIDEVQKYVKLLDYVFISPVFESISKTGYLGKFSEEELVKIASISEKVVALGGINKTSIKKAKEIGFKNVALLGNIWGDLIKIYEVEDQLKILKEKVSDLEEFSQIGKIKRPYVLSIAGFDPSGGAGILADIKTFEQHKTLGLSVCTAITYQNEDEYQATEWLSRAQIIRQLDILMDKYNVEYLKIGIIESIELLKSLVSHIMQKYPDTKIIWDTVIKATAANFSFHSTISKDDLNMLLDNIYLITPNTEEMRFLFGIYEVDIPLLLEISKKHNVNILLKGGHQKDERGVVSDILVDGESSSVYEGDRFHGYSKHGTGCILSSAITAGLANRLNLKDACREAKNYVEMVITSNNSRLGYHYDKLQ